MYFLYVLKNEDGKHYTGITADISNRLAEHNGGEVKSTRPYRPWRLAYTEPFATKTEARRREIFLKRTARAREELFGTL